MKVPNTDHPRDGTAVPDVDVGPVRIGPGSGLVLIAGPCVMESRSHTLRLAEAIHKTAQAAGVPLIFKASYDKANRSSLGGFRGPGLDEGLEILAEVRQSIGAPVTSDIHLPGQAEPAGQVLDLTSRSTSRRASSCRPGRCAWPSRRYVHPERAVSC